MVLIDRIKKEVIELLEKSKIAKGVDIEKTLEEPPETKFGDLASNISFHLAKKLKKNPEKLAKNIVESISIPENSLVEKVEAKNGYINFFFDYRKLAETVLKEILSEELGIEDFGFGKKVMVEFSQPNPVHPMHVGHARSTFLGESLSNILEFLGFDVIRANYMNDTGLQVAKLVTAYKLWGEGKEPEGKPDLWLWKFYVKFHEEAKKNPDLEKKAREMLRKFEVERDEKTRELWDKVVRWCISGFQETYRKLGVEFDIYFFESDFREAGKKLIERALEKGIAFKSEEGTIVADLEKYGLSNCVLLRSDGTGLYITSDLGMTVHKFEEYNLDESIWVVASSQNLHFKQLFKILELLGYPWTDKCYHFSFHHVHLPEGKMSSREGRAVMIDEVLQKLIERVLKEVEKKNPDLPDKGKLELAKKIAVGAFKYNILKVEPHKPITFDWERMLSLEGDTGPYLQYAFVRATKILEKAGEWEMKFSIDNINEKEKTLIKELSNLSQVILEAGKNKKPHHICNYAHELAEKFSDFYHSCPVIKAENEELRNFRLTLVKAFKIALGICLRLLGIETPSFM